MPMPFSTCDGRVALMLGLAAFSMPARLALRAAPTPSVADHPAAQSTKSETESLGAAKDGVIALQMHPGPPMKVQFRNLRIKLR